MIKREDEHDNDEHDGLLYSANRSVDVFEPNPVFGDSWGLLAEPIELEWLLPQSPDAQDLPASSGTPENKMATPPSPRGILSAQSSFNSLTGSNSITPASGSDDEGSASSPEPSSDISRASSSSGEADAAHVCRSLAREFCSEAACSGASTSKAPSGASTSASTSMASTSKDSSGASTSQTPRYGVFVTLREQRGFARRVGEPSAKLLEDQAKRDAGWRESDWGSS